jgi:hypothetical protein
MSLSLDANGLPTLPMPVAHFPVYDETNLATKTLCGRDVLVTTLLWTSERMANPRCRACLRVAKKRLGRKAARS